MYLYIRHGAHQRRSSLLLRINMLLLLRLLLRVLLRVLLRLQIR
jgi:hypothetical protein